MKKTLSLILVAVMLMALALSGCGTEAPSQESTTPQGSTNPGTEVEPITLKFAHHYSTDSFFGQLAQTFSDTVAEMSGGAIDVQIFSDSVLGTEEQAIEALQGGTIDFTITGTMLQTTVPMLGLVQGPFLFENWEHAKTVMQGELGDRIYAMFEEGGLKAICTFGEGFREFVLVNPIYSMEDFQGYPMRMASYANMLALADALGCNTTGSPMGEVFTSMQTGVFDGCDAVYSAITSYSWQEVANYILESNHAFSSSAICISTKTWDKLTDAQKQILEEASAVVSDDAWAQAEQVEQEEKQKVIDAGCEIITPDEEFIEQMKEATYSVWEDMFAEVDGMEDLYNDIKALAK